MSSQPAAPRPLPPDVSEVEPVEVVNRVQVELPPVILNAARLLTLSLQFGWVIFLLWVVKLIVEAVIASGRYR